MGVDVGVDVFFAAVTGFSVWYVALLWPALRAEWRNRRQGRHGDAA